MIKKSKNFVIQSSKDILGGETVFKGTRVPIRNLIDYFEAGDCLDDFLQDYPTVKKSQVIAVLEIAKQGITKK